MVEDAEAYTERDAVCQQCRNNQKAGIRYICMVLESSSHLRIHEDIDTFGNRDQLINPQRHTLAQARVTTKPSVVPKFVNENRAHPIKVHSFSGAQAGHCSLYFVSHGDLRQLTPSRELKICKCK